MLQDAEICFWKTELIVALSVGRLEQKQLPKRSDIQTEPAAAPTEGMDVDALAWILTAALGVLTATTSVATSHLFGQKPR